MTDRIPLTQDHIEASYELGKQVCGGKKKRDAVEELDSVHGMSKGSAGRYLQAFRSMKKGVPLNQSVNPRFIIYYFENAWKEHGKEQIKISLECLESNIDYYFKKPREQGGGDAQELRDLYNEYSELIGSPKRL